MKKRLKLLWVILVIPILCSSPCISLRVTYTFNILMVLTRSQGNRWSSSPAVLIMCREMNSCTNVLIAILWGNIRILNSDVRARIRGIQYQHASCIQIGNCTPSWITYYLCYILHGWLVMTFLLMRKLLASKVHMWIRW